MMRSRQMKFELAYGAVVGHAGVPIPGFPRSPRVRGDPGDRPDAPDRRWKAEDPVG